MKRTGITEHVRNYWLLTKLMQTFLTTLKYIQTTGIVNKKMHLFDLAVRWMFCMNTKPTASEQLKAMN